MIPLRIFWLLDAAIVIAAFAAAHSLTPSLHPLRDMVVSLAQQLSPWLARQLQPEMGSLPPFRQVAWMLLVVAPTTLLSLMGLHAYGNFTCLSRTQLLVCSPLAVAAGLAFASLTIVGLHLENWSRLFLLTFGALAATGLTAVRVGVRGWCNLRGRSGYTSRNLPGASSHPNRLAGNVEIQPERPVIDVPGIPRDLLIEGGSRVPVRNLSQARRASTGAQFPGSAEAIADGLRCRAAGHGVSVELAELVDAHGRHVQGILDKIASKPVVSQRSLARELGIALGLTNLLLRKIARQGWVRLVRVRPNRVRYLITPAGLAAKAGLYRRQLAENVHFYVETRDRIQETLAVLSRGWPDVPGSNGSRERRIALYGAGEIAEIGFICLHDTDFKLVGIVDECPKGSFFGRPVHSLDNLNGMSIDSESFDQIVIMSFGDTESIRSKLMARGVPADVIHTIS